MDLRRLIPVTLVTVALGVSFSPIASAQLAPAPAGHGSGAASPATAAQYIPVHTMGTARNESTDPAVQTFTFPLYSMVDGSLVGTATDVLTCSQTVPPPCAVIDATTTFRLIQGGFPLGTILNHAQVSIVPDPQRPGFVINGTRSSQPTITGGTGAYAGRTGTVNMSGTNGVTGYPNELTQDDYWLIALQ